jgi:hypothetical protein
VGLVEELPEFSRRDEVAHFEAPYLLSPLALTAGTGSRFTRDRGYRDF